MWYINTVLKLGKCGDWGIRTVFILLMSKNIASAEVSDI